MEEQVIHHTQTVFLMRQKNFSLEDEMFSKLKTRINKNAI